MIKLQFFYINNDKFWAFPEFIITPSLVAKLSTTTANDDGSRVKSGVTVYSNFRRITHLFLDTSWFNAENLIFA